MFAWPRFAFFDSCLCLSLNHLVTPDISGFTGKMSHRFFREWNTKQSLTSIFPLVAWSSVRSPEQVFSLLETLFHAFDEIALRRRVYKVETSKWATNVASGFLGLSSLTMFPIPPSLVGDCYVAAAVRYASCGFEVACSLMCRFSRHLFPCDLCAGSL